MWRYLTGKYSFPKASTLRPCFPRHRMGLGWGQRPGQWLPLHPLSWEDGACEGFKLLRRVGKPLVSSPITRPKLTWWSKKETKPQAPVPRMWLEPQRAISVMGSQPPEVYSILWKWAREKARCQAPLSEGQRRLKHFRFLLGYFRNYWPCSLPKTQELNSLTPASHTEDIFRKPNILQWLSGVCIYFLILRINYLGRE